MNKAVRWILLSFAVLVILVSGALASLLLPSVQSYIGHKVAEALNQNIPQQINVNHIDIRPSGRICLSGLSVLDQRGDTLMAADSVKARMSLWGILRNKFSFSQVEIYKPQLSVVKYAGEPKNTLVLFIDNFKQEKKKNKKPFYLGIGQVKVYGGTFSLRDDNTGKYDYLRDVSLEASDVSIQPGDYHADIDSLGLLSSFGTSIRSLSGSFRLCPQGIIADKVNLITNRSSLRFSANSYFPRRDTAARRLIDKIKASQASLSIEPSHVDPEDVAAFFPEAAKMPAADLSARLTTQPGMLDIKALQLSLGEILSLNLSGRFETAKSLREGNGKIVLKHIEILPIPVIALMNGITGKYIPKKTYDKIAGIQKLSGNGLITLEKENVTAVLSLLTLQQGKIYIQAQSNDLWSKKNIRYTAKAVLENVNAGLFTGSPALGKVTLFSSIRGRGLDPHTASAEFNTSIPLLELKGYPYTGIDLSARLFGGRLTSDILINDPNLQAKLFATLETKSHKNYALSLDTYLDKSDLHALGLVKDSIVGLRGTIEANLSGSNLNNIVGSLAFSEISYTNDNNLYYIDRVDIRSEILDSIKRRLSIESADIFNGYIEGNYLLSEVPSAVMNGLFSRFSTYRTRKVTPGQEYSFRLNVTAKKLKIVNTPLTFEGRTALGGAVNSSNNDFAFGLIADRMYYKDILVDTLNFRLDTSNDSVLNVRAQKFINPVYSIENLDFSAQRQSDTLVSIRTDFYKRNSADSVYFHIRAYQKDDPDGNLTIGFLPSIIHLERMNWQFGGYSPSRDRIQWNVHQGSLRVDSLDFRSGNALISANGFYASKDLMDIRLSVQSLDLSRIVTLKNNTPFRGMLDCLVHLSKNQQDKTIIPEVSLNIDSLGIAAYDIGNLRLAVKADLANHYINTSARLDHAHRTLLELTGGMQIDQRQLHPDMSLVLDSLPLDAVHYLLPSVFNKSTGYASASLDIGGIIKEPEINGHVQLDGTRLGINFTNVEYAVADSTIVPVKNSAFYFDKIRLRDILYSTYATLDGRIYHEHFNPWLLSLDIQTDKTLVMNTHGENNQKFYGKVFATGALQLNGPTNALRYKIAARTERHTDFSIDIGSTSDFKDSPMISFVPPPISHKDSLLLNLEKPKSILESSSEMDIALEATPEATLRIYLDKTSGHMIEANGLGKMRMHLSPKGSFSLFGTYEVTAGNYTFVYKNLIKKPFNILSGGKITFDGDPSNPDIDISAAYKTTVKPSSLLSSVSDNAREEVIATIHLTGSLSDIVYNFDIQMPRATENVREELAYRISDQEQLNQQFISLLVLNSFTNTGGEGENQNIVSTGVTGLTASMLSNQFSNLLQRFVKGVDINVNLNSSTNKYTGQTMSQDFEVGISTKLFDDRVTVNGVVGVPTGTTQSNLVGDVDIEYNISADGRFRAIFVNRRQEDYMSNQQGYVQSIGVSYRQEFNSFHELWQLIRQAAAGKKAPERRKARQEKKAERKRGKAEEKKQNSLTPPNREAIRQEPNNSDTTGAKVYFK